MDVVAIIISKIGDKQCIHKVVGPNDEAIKVELSLLAEEFGLKKEDKYSFLCNDFGYAYGYKNKDRDIWFEWWYVA